MRRAASLPLVPECATVASCSSPCPAGPVSLTLGLVGPWSGQRDRRPSPLTRATRPRCRHPGNLPGRNRHRKSDILTFVDRRRTRPTARSTTACSGGPAHTPRPTPTSGRDSFTWKANDGTERLECRDRSPSRSRRLTSHQIVSAARSPRSRSRMTSTVRSTTRVIPTPSSSATRRAARLVAVGGTFYGPSEHPRRWVGLAAHRRSPRSVSRQCSGAGTSR